MGRIGSRDEGLDTGGSGIYRFIGGGMVVLFYEFEGGDPREGMVVWRSL